MSSPTSDVAAGHGATSQLNAAARIAVLQACLAALNCQRLPVGASSPPSGTELRHFQADACQNAVCWYEENLFLIHRSAECGSPFSGCFIAPLIKLWLLQGHPSIALQPHTLALASHPTSWLNSSRPQLWWPCILSLLWVHVLAIADLLLAAVSGPMLTSFPLPCMRKELLARHAFCNRYTIIC